MKNNSYRKRNYQSSGRRCFEKLFSEHENYFEFDASLIPDLSNFTKEELVGQLLQFQLRDMALYYENRNDIAEQKFNGRDDSERGSRRERSRATETGTEETETAETVEIVNRERKVKTWYVSSLT